MKTIRPEARPAAAPPAGGAAVADAGGVLVVIPAALHGEGLPRKVLRSLNERPLLLHAIDVARAVAASARDVLVVADDDEVVLWAEREGCRTVESRDMTGDRFDAVVYDSVARLEAEDRRSYDVIAILDPSAPLIRPGDLQRAIARVAAREFDTVISACEAPHRTWVAGMSGDGGLLRAEPGDHVAGPRRFTEISGFTVSHRPSIQPWRFVGPSVGLAVIDRDRAIEITSPNEWWICERLLRRRRIVWVVAGNRRVGMGHIYRTLQLAHEINNHEIVVVCTRDSDLAANVFMSNQYETVVQREESLADVVCRQQPDLVVNDFLDTDRDYIAELKSRGIKVVNFEDLGTGAEIADIVFNELYHEQSPQPNHRVGPDFFFARSEFFEVDPGPFRTRVEEVLITFGGADEGNLTSRVLEAIWPEARLRGVHVSIVTGNGYGHGEVLDRQLAAIGDPLVTRTNGTKRMSEYMARADLAFSSAGRTLFELATLRVPTIVMAANEREAMHPFASSHSGFQYLGPHDRVSDAALRDSFSAVLDDTGRRRAMRTHLESFDFRDGKKRVLAHIGALLDFPLS